MNKHKHNPKSQMHAYAQQATAAARAALMYSMQQNAPAHAFDFNVRRVVTYCRIIIDYIEL